MHQGAAAAVRSEQAQTGGADLGDGGWPAMPTVGTKHGEVRSRVKSKEKHFA